MRDELQVEQRLLSGAWESGANGKRSGTAPGIVDPDEDDGRGCQRKADHAEDQGGLIVIVSIEKQ